MFGGLKALWMNTQNPPIWWDESTNYPPEMWLQNVHSFGSILNGVLQTGAIYCGDKRWQELFVQAQGAQEFKIDFELNWIVKVSTVDIKAWHACIQNAQGLLKKDSSGTPWQPSLQSLPQKSENFPLYREQSCVRGALTVSRSSGRRHQSRADNIYHTQLRGHPDGCHICGVITLCVCDCVRERVRERVCKHDSRRALQQTAVWIIRLIKRSGWA